MITFWRSCSIININELCLLLSFMTSNSLWSMVKYVQKRVMTVRYLILGLVPIINNVFLYYLYFLDICNLPSQFLNILTLFELTELFCRPFDLFILQPCTRLVMSWNDLPLSELEEKCIYVNALPFHKTLIYFLQINMLIYFLITKLL